MGGTAGPLPPGIGGTLAPPPAPAFQPAPAFPPPPPASAFPPAPDFAAFDPGQATYVPVYEPSGAQGRLAGFSRAAGQTWLAIIGCVGLLLASLFLAGAAYNRFDAVQSFEEDGLSAVQKLSDADDLVGSAFAVWMLAGVFFLVVAIIWFIVARKNAGAVRLGTGMAEILGWAITIVGGVMTIVFAAIDPGDLDEAKRNDTILLVASLITALGAGILLVAINATMSKQRRRAAELA